ncbi:MAG: DUF559 domain-containing protein [Chloroflexi bacterium]|nr:DUF559 domain-containing protein [Chloroflexota bacterium]
MKRKKQPSDGLIAILNSQRDFEILQREGWYRIPVTSAPRRWPPRWLAFYQTKVFEAERYAVRYYGEVAGIESVRRAALFPHEGPNPKSNREYYKVSLHELKMLPQPILSRRPRRIVFVPTTWQKFTAASEFNDLFDESPLEDDLWKALRSWDIQAERQWPLDVGKQFFALDFAIFCNGGRNIDVETDGDSYHIGKKEGIRDRRRNNAVATVGWQVLRFNTLEIREQMAEYCMPKILETINQLDGLQEEAAAPRLFYSTAEGTAQQLSLLEGGEEYDADE